MAKKQVETKEVAVVQPAALPSLEGASNELKARIADLADNLESLQDFRLPRAKMTAEGFELMEGQEPVTELEGVIIHTKRTNVYYDKPYNVNSVEPPTCFSLDGEVPDASIKKPIHKTCRGCPMAEFGTNQMKSGKACRNLKPLYMLLSDEAIMPRQLTVTPASLKVANNYLLELTERGIPYRKVWTKVTAYKDNPRDTYMKLRFSMGKKIAPEQQNNIDFLKNYWRPVMDAQVIDQREVDPATNTPVVETGEY